MSRFLKSASIPLVLTCTIFDLAAGFYTNQGAFHAAITATNFTTNLSSLPLGVVASPLTLGSSISVQAISTNTDPGSGYQLYSTGDSLTVNPDSGGIFFTNFSPGITAFGGHFFTLNSFDTPISIFPADIFLTITFADTSSQTANVYADSVTNFLGFVGSSEITSATISSTAGPPATTQITLGTAVPEPSTFALVALSLVGLAARCFRRRS